MNAIVRTHALTKRYGGETVVRDLELTVPEGYIAPAAEKVTVAVQGATNEENESCYYVCIERERCYQ